MNLFVKMSVLYNCAKGRWFTAHTAHSWKFVYIFVLMWSSVLCFLWYHLVKQLHSCKKSKKVFDKEYKMPPRQGKQFIMNLLICISLSETHKHWGFEIVQYGLEIILNEAPGCCRQWTFVIEWLEKTCKYLSVGKCRAPRISWLATSGLLVTVLSSQPWLLIL